MKIGANCKFCHKPITLTIDDSYNAISDPLKLIPLAACNRCADLRVEKGSLEKKIQFNSMQWHLSGKKPVDEIKTRTVLEKQLKQYANLIARWHNQEGMAWCDAVLDQIMEQPKSWSDVITRLWQMYRSTQTA